MGDETTSLILREENREENAFEGRASAANFEGTRSDAEAHRTDAEAHRSGQLSTESADVADDDSIREFYSQLVTLLTQENAPAPKKTNRNTLLATLRRRWLPALLVSALAFAGFITLLRPRKSTYQVSVTLLLPPRTTLASQNPDPFAPPEESYDTEAELAIIGSEDIVRTAMSRVPDSLKVRGWGSKNVPVAPVEAVSYGSPSLVNINVSSMDYLASRRLSNEMVSTYIDYTRNRYNRNREDNLKITKQQVETSGAALENARSQLRRFKESSGVFDSAPQAGSGSASIAELESDLAKARSEAIGGSERDGALDILQQRALEAQAQYQDTLVKFFPTSPRALEAERKWRRAAAQSQSRSQQARASSARRIAQIQVSLGAARRRASALPGVEQSLNRLNDRVQLLGTAYRGASDRYNQLNLARGTVAPTARVLNSPTGGSSRQSQLMRALAVSLLGALGLGVLGAWLANHFDRSVRTISDPDQLFDVPILGVMPAVGGKSGFQLSSASLKRGRSAGQNATIEACYTTQFNLLAAAKNFEAQSILITSAMPGEGKSQCASNLATAMAYGGQKVLLIDADFLHPSQHEILKMSIEPGYAQVLQDALTLSSVVRLTHVSNLHLLSAGKNALKNPEELISLLSGPAHQSNLKELAKHYDVILIDGPPTMSMADAQLLSGMADSLVLVAAEKTHQEEVYRARSMLRLAGGLLLGVIVNSVSLREMGNWNLNFSPEAPFANYAHSLHQRNR